MATWERFNDAMEQLIDEGSVFLKQKLDSKEIGVKAVDNLRREFLDQINGFYAKLDDELVKGYDPYNFDLTAAIKDLTVGMLETFVHIGTGGATAVAKAVGKQLAIDFGKRLAGFDGPTEDFKNPMDRTIEATTKVLGNNAIGRTIGRIFGVLDDMFNPNKARDEFRRIRAQLKDSQTEIAVYLSNKFARLREEGLKRSAEFRGEQIQSNMKSLLKQKLDAFVKRMKDFPFFARALRKTLTEERNVDANYLPNLIKESYAFTSTPSTADDFELLEKAGLREKWRNVRFALESQAFRATPGLERMGAKPTATPGFFSIPNLNEFLGFDASKMWFWSLTSLADSETI